MLPQTLDEQRRDGEVHEADVDMSSPRAQKRRYLYEVAQVMTPRGINPYKFSQRLDD